MASSNDGAGVSSVDLLLRYRAGEEDAATELYRLYSERLLALARSRLSARLARRVDADDIVQSAFRSFFAKTNDPVDTSVQDGDLWRLLATIVLNKVRRQVKRHRAAKRAVGRESDLNEQPDSAQIADREPSLVDVLMAANEIEWLFRRLEPSQRSAIELRLQEHSLEEIAARLQVNERTVRRWIAVAQQHLLERKKSFERDCESEFGICNWPFDGKDFADSADRLLPQDFLLERLIGSGGVSKAYVALQRSTGRRMCIKVLRRNLRGNAQLMSWFAGEARLVARLDHPHIVPILGLGQLPRGGLFLASQLIDGKNLADHLQLNSLSANDALGIVRTVASAVAHAHDRGVLHCDIKPQNVLIDSVGKVWLVDFGFGQLVAHDGTANACTAIAGTLGFMAPEQFDPSVGPLGYGTDIYGLGALLHVLVFGKPPDCGRCDTSTPTVFLNVIKKCLSPLPKNRYRTVSEFVSAFDTCDEPNGYTADTQSLVTRHK